VLLAYASSRSTTIFCSRACRTIPIRPRSRPLFPQGRSGQYPDRSSASLRREIVATPLTLDDYPSAHLDRTDRRPDRRRQPRPSASPPSLRVRVSYDIASLNTAIGHARHRNSPAGLARALSRSPGTCCSSPVSRVPSAQRRPHPWARQIWGRALSAKAIVAVEPRSMRRVPGQPPPSRSDSKPICPRPAYPTLLAAAASPRAGLALCVPNLEHRHCGATATSAILGPRSPHPTSATGLSSRLDHSPTPPRGIRHLGLLATRLALDRALDSIGDADDG